MPKWTSPFFDGSNGARTHGLPLVRRALIPAELCFHNMHYSTGCSQRKEGFPSFLFSGGKKFPVKDKLLQNTLKTTVFFKGKALRIMFFQGLTDVGVHRKSLQLVEPEEADAVGHLRPYTVELQQLCAGFGRFGPRPAHICFCSPDCIPAGFLYRQPPAPPESERRNSRCRPGRASASRSAGRDCGYTA